MVAKAAGKLLGVFHRRRGHAEKGLWHAEGHKTAITTDGLEIWDQGVDMCMLKRRLRKSAAAPER